MGDDAKFGIEQSLTTALRNTDSAHPSRNTHPEEQVNERKVPKWEM
jgi:hypothetical protein